MKFILPDLLTSNLKVVFCGTAASTQSAQVGAYYAGRGNRFWPTLQEIGLTPRLLDPSEFTIVNEFGIGLTDLAKRTSGNDSVLKTSDFDADAMTEKMLHYQPRFLAFTSKRAAQEYLGVKRIEYGLQPQVIVDTQLFVLPSPSGAARGYWDINYWHELAILIDQN